MATILDLLMALNRGDLPPLPRPAPTMPIPLAPVGNLGPLSDDTAAAFAAQNPEPVPPRFVQPAAPDAGFVNQEVGPEPTAPAPLSRGQRIANAIAGFGAGVQGQGAQFLAQLQEPQREYQRQLERYQGRRTEALDRAERRAEREAAQANRIAEAQYERDYGIYLKRLGIRQDEASERTRQAFEVYKLDRQAAEAERKDRVLLRRQIALQIDDRIKAYRDQGADKHSEELARNDFRMALEQAGEKVPPLSAAASKANRLVQAKLQRALRLAQGGGGGSAAATRRETQDLQRRTAQAAAGVTAMEKLARQAMETTREADRVPILNQMRSMAATLQAQFPDLLEVGEHNNWAFARLKPPSAAAPQQQQQPAAQKFSKAAVNEFARKNKRAPEEVEAEIRARGGIVE